MRFLGRKNRRLVVGTFVVVLALVILVGCAEDEESGTNETPPEQTSGATTMQEVDRAETTAATEGRGGTATLKIEGKSGTAFSGNCVVGGEEREMSGQIPMSFEFTLDGGELGCEIQKQGDGALEIIFTANGSSSIQRTNSANATINLSYSGSGGVSFSTTSQGGNGSVRQQIIQ